MVIKKIPDIPDGIINAVNIGNLAIISGAGISRIMGCLGWRDLSHSLLTDAFGLKDLSGNNLLDWREVKKLQLSDDNRKVITICHDLYRENGHEALFLDKMNKALTAEEYRCALTKGENIFTELNRLRGCHITTNGDTIFSGLGYFSTVITGSEIMSGAITGKALEPLSLVQLHGTMTDPDNLVFTLPKYLTLYRHPHVQDFLKMVFAKYTVLFVGYGLAELELLQYLIPASDEKAPPTRFLLEGYFSGEEKTADVDQRFYKVLGITLVPYELDKVGYSQLYSVIRKWGDHVTTRSKYITATYGIVDDFLKGL